jgi:hypothetical protein
MEENMSSEKSIEEMDQGELIEESNLYAGTSGESFEESAERFRRDGDNETADIFDRLSKRWWELEGETEEI